MREMAENGVLFDGVESNGGVMSSQWYTTTNFHKLYPMVKTASLHSFRSLQSWFGPVWCMHAQTMREMAENGVLFNGVKSNGGVRASKFDQ